MTHVHNATHTHTYIHFSVCGGTAQSIIWIKYIIRWRGSTKTAQRLCGDVHAYYVMEENSPFFGGAKLPTRGVARAPYYILQTYIYGPGKLFLMVRAAFKFVWKLMRDNCTSACQMTHAVYHEAANCARRQTWTWAQEPVKASSILLAGWN